MTPFKSLTKEGIPRALEKVDRYRLLNEPLEAESICRDILEVDPEHQKAITLLILTLTDQFNKGVTEKEAFSLLPKIKDDYKREYYRGIILERLAKATLVRNNPGSNFDAYEWLEDAMEAFQKAAAIRPAGNDDSILRYNACIRAIEKHHLTPRAPESVSISSE